MNRNVKKFKQLQKKQAIQPKLRNRIHEKRETNCPGLNNVLPKFLSTWKLRVLSYLEIGSLWMQLVKLK